MGRPCWVFWPGDVRMLPASDGREKPGPVIVNLCCERTQRENRCKRSVFDTTRLQS